MRPNKRARPGQKGTTPLASNDCIVVGDDATANDSYQTDYRQKDQQGSAHGSSGSVPDGLTNAVGLEETIPELRSCENCRRGKLKCSRSYPCSKCVQKGLDCVFGQDKRRGPKPGYVEEIHRRIDVLEQMVLGQSLLFRQRDGSIGSNPSDTTDFRAIVDNTRKRLLETQEGTGSLSGGYRETGAVQVLDQTSAQVGDTAFPVPSEIQLDKICDIYRAQIQPWIPILLPQLFYNTDQLPDDNQEPAIRPKGSQYKAVVAAAGPFLDQTAFDRKNTITSVRESVFSSLLGNASIETVHAAVILLFLLLGDGTIMDNWSLVTLLSQLALRAGLHLEVQHLSTQHHRYRKLIHMELDNSSWKARESTRRLFWVIFMLDHFASTLSGTQPGFESAKIRRQLPCNGEQWRSNEKVHTREFIQANVAVQMQITQDVNIGGLAYLIEATEIFSLASSFATQSKRTKMVQDDPQRFLKKFFNLDLTLANWKSRMPTHRLRADPKGYIDHNFTLAHVSHNCSGIMLYQSTRDFWKFGGIGQTHEYFHTSYVSLVKQAAKDVAQIGARFLLHRKYLLSPQFTFYQFLAARALLAYSAWFSEAVDGDFEILASSLSESSKRWSATESTIETDDAIGTPLQEDFAATLLSRLKMDEKNPASIDLTAAWTDLLAEMREIDHVTATTARAENTAMQSGSSDSLVSALRLDQGDTESRCDGEWAAHMSPTAYMPSTISGDVLDPGATGGASMPMLLSSFAGGALDNRVFSWKDYDDFLGAGPSTEQEQELTES
ncbi:unnamed protein product [Clonostachys rosea]|uniref:Zn(2)-C6 fungal-type domain-containing protein n=1 Tax=Bionectria ochroleuca TaxID=29856 RepID=A0ABY6TX71_BIOOC|nr:unnamed protein product [Clonostachys rosea]